MESIEEKYPVSVTEGESLSETPFVHAMVQPDIRSISEQPFPSPRSKISKDDIPDLGASANEDRFKIQGEEGQKIQEINVQARFFDCLTNVLPKYIATIPLCFVGARD